jgi:hypothetical protein
VLTEEVLAETFDRHLLTVGPLRAAVVHDEHRDGD